jgi:hypothetical protein
MRFAKRSTGAIPLASPGIGVRPFQENESLFDGLEAAAEASIFGESIVCSSLMLHIGIETTVQAHRLSGVDAVSPRSTERNLGFHDLKIPPSDGALRPLRE